MPEQTKDISGFNTNHKATPPKGKNYLFAIAIDTYDEENGIPKLSNCVKDAKDFIKVLKRRFGFLEEHMFTIFDQEATLENINTQLDKLTSRVTPEDKIIVYFSGHGFYKKHLKEGYLIPVDGRKGASWGYLSNANFLTYIRSINSFHTFLIIDSCFSGSLFATKSLDYTYSDRSFMFPSRWGLAAGRIEKVSDGFHGENSPFAKSIITYLDKTQEAKIPVSDLIQYVKRTTARNAKQTPIGGQLFNVGDMDGEFVFELNNSLQVSENEESAPSEKIAFEKAVNSNDWDQLIAFLETAKNKHYKKEIRKLLKLKEQETTWLNVNKNSYAAIDEFLDENPNSVFREDARALMLELKNRFGGQPEKQIHKPSIPSNKDFTDVSVGPPDMDDLNELLEENKFKKILDQLDFWLTGKDNLVKLRDDVNAQQRILTNMENLARMGLMNSNQDDLKRNQFRVALMYLLDEVEEAIGDFQNTKSTSETLFTDPRDGQQYKTVQLRDGKTWLAENFNFDTGEGCSFYDNDPENGKKYGRLYTWEAAKKAAPAGWHLPSDEEWSSMINLYGGFSKDESHQENSTFQSLVSGGDSGFAATFGGERDHNNAFDFIDIFGTYWGATKSPMNTVWTFRFVPVTNKVYRHDANTDMYALSCRYIKD